MKTVNKMEKRKQNLLEQEASSRLERDLGFCDFKRFFYQDIELFCEDIKNKLQNNELILLVINQEDIKNFKRMIPKDIENPVILALIDGDNLILACFLRPTPDIFDLFWKNHPVTDRDNISRLISVVIHRIGQSFGVDLKFWKTTKDRDRVINHTIKTIIENLH